MVKMLNRTICGLQKRCQSWTMSPRKHGKYRTLFVVCDLQRQNIWPVSTTWMISRVTVEQVYQRLARSVRLATGPGHESDERGHKRHGTGEVSGGNGNSAR